MRNLTEYINESAKSVSDEMYDLLVKEFEKTGRAQSTVESFLSKCFDDAPHKDFHTEVGDAVLSIYESYIK